MLFYCPLVLLLVFVRVDVTAMARNPSVSLATLFLLALSVCTEATLSYAQEPPPEPPTNSFIICKNQKNVRTIRVEKNTKDGICIAFYTKAGLDKEVGRAQSDVSCLKVIANIKGNLESAGWKCKGHDKVSMTGPPAETSHGTD